MAEPYSGSSCTFLMDFEASYGTVKGTPAPRQVAIISESINGTQNLSTNPSIRPDGNKAQPANGHVRAEGQLQLVSTVDAAPWFLKWLCHSIATTGVGDPYTHTSKWNLSTATVNSAVVQVQFATGVYKLIKGLRVKSLNMKFMSEGFLTWTIDVAGSRATYETSNTLTGTPTDWTGSTPFEHTGHLAAADTKIDTVASTVVSEVDFTITQNLQEDDYRAGQSGYRSGLAVGSQELVVKIKMPVTSTSEMTFMQSTSSHSLDMTYTAAANRSLRVYVPAFIVQKTLPNVSTDLGIFTEIEGRAFYHSGTASQIQFVTINANAGTLYA